MQPALSIRTQALLSAIVLSASAILLFARLGHYALWDDEAITALTAIGVWNTGDTFAVVDHNILAYRNGLLLRDMKDRATPPLQFYMSAPFLGIFGRTALAARLPFALCGLGSVALILWWLHRDSASETTWVLSSLAILGNVSFFLYNRQCRYYGLAMLLCIATAYVYLHVQSRRGLVLYVVLSLLLLAANYMTFAAISLMVAIDYIFWGRRRRKLRAREWVLVLLPVVAVGGVIVLIWNPLRAVEPRQEHSWIGWHATLLWWNVRDMNVCEFGVGLLLLAAPIVALWMKSVNLLRAVVALAAGIFVISMISPQNPSNLRVADIRYLSFLIPLCMAVGVMTLSAVAHLSRAAVVAVAVVAFGSNLLNFSPLTSQPVRSTPFALSRELVWPVPEPFTPASVWIDANVKPGDSILAAPPHMMYPLMFHAPNGVYAWQLNEPPPAQLANVLSIHVALREAPEYIVAFGPGRQLLREVKLPPYEVVHRIDVYWKDSYRPELFWHRFEAPKSAESQGQGVVIYRRARSGFEFRL